MEDTIKELRKVFEDCLFIVAEKDLKYGGMWKDEDLDELWGNVSRKFEGVKHQYKETPKVDEEFPLDLINYTAFFLLRLKKAGKVFKEINK